jgi:hypothetical protein
MSGITSAAAAASKAPLGSMPDLGEFSSVTKQNVAKLVGVLHSDVMESAWQKWIEPFPEGVDVTGYFPAATPYVPSADAPPISPIDKAEHQVGYYIRNFVAIAGFFGSHKLAEGLLATAADLEGVERATQLFLDAVSSGVAALPGVAPLAVRRVTLLSKSVYPAALYQDALRNQFCASVVAKVLPRFLSSTGCVDLVTAYCSPLPSVPSAHQKRLQMFPKEERPLFWDEENPSRPFSMESIVITQLAPYLAAESGAQEISGQGAEGPPKQTMPKVASSMQGNTARGFPPPRSGSQDRGQVGLINRMATATCDCHFCKSSDVVFLTSSERDAAAKK